MTTKANAPSSAATRTVIWDSAIRIFHWTAAALIPLAWWTAENGHMDWHRRIGLTVLGLVVFRLYWGLAGTKTARFANFVRGPKAVLAYVGRLKRPYTPSPGHNPLGALSVIALIAALAAQVTLGLFAVDVDGIESGPLSHLVSFETGRAAAELHETSFKVLLTLIGLHVAAIAFYAFALRTNLVGTMVTGKRAASRDGGKPVNAGSFPFVRFAIGVAIAASVVSALVQI